MSKEIKIVRSGGYTVLPNEVLRDPAMSLAAKGLFCVMLSLPDGWDYSVQGLAAICQCGRDRVASALKNMEDAGYLLREQSHDKHGRFANTYVVYDVKQAIPTPDRDGFSVTVNPQHRAGKTVTEKPQQLKKDNKNKTPIIPREIVMRIEQYAAEDEELQKAIYDFIENRAAVKKPVKTVRSINGIFRDLDRISGGASAGKIRLLENAIVHNWLTVYADHRDDQMQWRMEEQPEPSPAGGFSWQ